MKENEDVEVLISKDQKWRVDRGMREPTPSTLISKSKTMLKTFILSSLLDLEPTLLYLEKRGWSNMVSYLTFLVI